MTKLKSERYVESLNLYRQSWMGSSASLLVAICMTKLEDYPGALAQYRKTLSEFLLPGKMNWRSDINLASVWWLVHTYILGLGQGPLADMVLEVESHKRDEHGEVSPALYSYATMCLLAGRDAEALSYVPGILALPKVKQYYPIAKVIQALVDADPGDVNNGLAEVLSAHLRVARYGHWRQSPEGYLCLPAMCLSLIARKRGISLTVESEYLSPGYLDYLDSLPEARDWPMR